jgi:hypothetical protein
MLDAHPLTITAADNAGEHTCTLSTRRCAANDVGPARQPWSPMNSRFTLTHRAWASTAGRQRSPPCGPPLPARHERTRASTSAAAPLRLLRQSRARGCSGDEAATADPSCGVVAVVRYRQRGRQRHGCSLVLARCRCLASIGRLELDGGALPGAVHAIRAKEGAWPCSLLSRRSRGPQRGRSDADAALLSRESGALGLAYENSGRLARRPAPLVANTRPRALTPAGPGSVPTRSFVPRRVPALTRSPLELTRSAVEDVRNGRAPATRPDARVGVAPLPSMYSPCQGSMTGSIAAPAMPWRTLA